MKMENELCRKIYEHHTVMKNEISSVILEICSKAGLKREDIAVVAGKVGASVDSSTNKMVIDFQKTIKKINENSGQ